MLGFVSTPLTCTGSCVFFFSKALILSAIELLHPLIASSSNGFFSIVRGIPACIIVLSGFGFAVSGGAGISCRLLRKEFLFA